MDFKKLVEKAEASKKEHFKKVVEENERKIKEKKDNPYFKGYKPKMYFNTSEDTDKEFEDIDFKALQELDDLPPLEIKPTLTTHICETREVSGKKFSWSCWLGRGEKCPVCEKVELDEEGNKLK